MLAPAPPDPVKMLPAYTLAEAARYVGVSESTMRTWFRGRPARSTKSGGFRRAAVKPVLPTGANPRAPLSFIDLIEAHILFSIRKAYKVPMKKVKAAKEYVATLSGNLILLAHRDFFYDHSNLYIGSDKTLLSLSERGQFADKLILEEGLKQVTYGADGFANQYFPKVGGTDQREFVVNPAINYGRLSIVRLGVGADAVAERFLAGEKVEEIADDYGATTDEVEEAIRWHERLAA